MTETTNVDTHEIQKPEQSSEWQYTADICVVGAGVAGLAAALESARLGKKVILLDSEYQVGGQAYNSVIGCFCGFFSNYAEPDASDCRQLTHLVADDMFHYLKEHNGYYFRIGTSNTLVPYYNENTFLRWAEKALRDAGVKTILGVTLTDVGRSGSRITGLTAAHRFGRIHITADGFIDCSGDATLAWLAGATCRLPSRNVYGSEMFILEGIDFSHPTPAEEELMEHMEACADKYSLHRTKGLMFYTPERHNTAYGNMTHVDIPLEPAELTKVSMEGKDYVDDVVHFLKAEYPANFSGADVRTYGHVGMRQTRWLKGVRQLTLEEARSGLRQKDAVCRTAWPVELHDHGTGYIWEVFGAEHIHYIPLSAMITPELDNYAAAGRCIDGDVATLSSVRVMGPCMGTGAAAAHALAMAGKDGSVHTLNLSRLQEELKVNLEDEAQE